MVRIERNVYHYISSIVRWWSAVRNSQANTNIDGCDAVLQQKHFVDVLLNESVQHSMKGKVKLPSRAVWGIRLPDIIENVYFF